MIIKICLMFFWLDQVVDIAGLDGKFGIGFYFGRKVLKSVYLSYRGEDGIFEDDIEKKISAANSNY